MDKDNLKTIFWIIVAVLSIYLFFHFKEFEEFSYTQKIKYNLDNSKEYYIKRAQIRSKLNKDKEAIEDYTKVISLNPRNHLAYYNRGLLKFIIGNFREALIDANKAIEINKNKGTYYWLSGIIKNKLKYYKEAILDFDKSIKLNYEWHDVFEARAEAKLALGDTLGWYQDNAIAKNLENEEIEEEERKEAFYQKNDWR